MECVDEAQMLIRFADGPKIPDGCPYSGSVIMWCCCCSNALRQWHSTPVSKACAPIRGWFGILAQDWLIFLMRPGQGSIRVGRSTHSLTRRSRRTPTLLRAIAHVVSCLPGLVGVFSSKTSMATTLRARRCGSCTSHWPSAATLIHCKPSLRHTADALSPCTPRKTDHGTTHTPVPATTQKCLGPSRVAVNVSLTCRLQGLLFPSDFWKLRRTPPSHSPSQVPTYCAVAS